jgi:hypothetical protein
MNTKYLVAIFLIGLLATVTGCSLNKINKNVNVLPGLFGNNLKTLDTEFQKLEVGISKEEVGKRGFDLSKSNIECYKGPEAMKYILGTERNDPGVSTATEIQEYAEAIRPYESCLIFYKKVRAVKDRFYFSKRNSKSNGVDFVYIISFKNEKVFDFRKIQISKNEKSSEKSFGGNILDSIISNGVSAARRAF